MRALLIANRLDADPGFVGEHLGRRGFTFVPASREDPGAWPDLASVDLVLALGSDWSVYWDHVQPSVAAEVAVVVEAHARGVPVLGICFGGQVMAHALGGRVEGAPEPEVGWFPVESTVPAVAGDGPWFQWHADRFTAPAGAQLLARSARAEQAFRIGRSLALQFHPEVDGSIIGRWAADGARELERLAIDADALLLRSRSEVARTALSSDRLVDWFLDEVAASAV